MSIAGLTFDTGVLIALERRAQRAWTIYRAAQDFDVPITVPAPVIAEWWRGRSRVREHVKSGFVVEPLSDALASLAGEALSKVRGAGTIDAIVMASAALRGDVVYTSDLADLQRLATFFPNVRVLAI